MNLEAVYPDAQMVARGVSHEYRIAHYHLDVVAVGLKYGGGPKCFWSVFTEPSSEVSYHESLDAAIAEAQDWEHRHRRYLAECERAERRSPRG